MDTRIQLNIAESKSVKQYIFNYPVYSFSFESDFCHQTGTKTFVKSIQENIAQHYRVRKEYMLSDKL